MHSLWGVMPFFTTKYIKLPTNNKIGIINGYMNAIDKKTVIVLNVVKDARLVIPGKTKSKIDISLENLVKILPKGLESKNIILDLITFSTILVCILEVLDTRIY